MTMGELAGQVAFVTGGESGIGAASAKALAAEGAAVAITYFSDTAAADKVCAAIGEAGGKALAVQCDVGDEGQVEAAFAKVGRELGVPQILVNSAGLNMAGVNVVDMELKEWDRLIRTDLTGSFLTSRALARGLTGANKPGRIINISSIHGYAVRAGGADYCSAKGGLDNLTRTMAIEVAPMGITVNAIAPGMILTPMNDRAQTDETYRKSLEQNIPEGRAGRAEEVGAMVVYLASEKASYVTGTIMAIDGGLSLLQAVGA
jgi:glucose 1-dehydrogenase